jgi:flagellar biosynthesis/type III secretory pathway protein FliH
MKKLLYTFLVVSIIFSACNKYEIGYDEGYEEALQLGKEEGYEEGYSVGYDEASENCSEKMEKLSEKCSEQMDEFSEFASILCENQIDEIVRSCQELFNQSSQNYNHIDYGNFIIEIEKELEKKYQLEIAREILNELNENE